MQTYLTPENTTYQATMPASLADIPVSEPPYPESRYDRETGRWMLPLSAAAAVIKAMRKALAGSVTHTVTADGVSCAFFLEEIETLRSKISLQKDAPILWKTSQQTGSGTPVFIRLDNAAIMMAVNSLEKARQALFDLEHELCRIIEGFAAPGLDKDGYDAALSRIRLLYEPYREYVSPEALLGMLDILYQQGFQEAVP